MERIFKIEKRNRRIQFGYGIALILLVIAYFVTFYANRKLVEQSRRLEQTNIIINQLEVLLSKVKDAETGVRGYVLTKKDHFLEPYSGSRRAVDSIFFAIQKIKKDAPEQKEQLKNLQDAIAKRFGMLSGLLQYFDSNNKQVDDSLASMIEESNKSMNECRANVAIIQNEEYNLHVSRDKDIKATFVAINVITITSLSVALVLNILSYLTYKKENKARKLAIKEVNDYQEQLKNRVEELNKANAELITMRRSEKFAATGRIARTIAHEVRNPLTNINLATDQLKSESEDGEEYSAFLFEMISRNSNRINQLISDLLTSTKFSDLSFEKISVNYLLDEALHEAEDRIALTNVKVIRKYSSDVCDVNIDKAKIKIAFLNIIINAVEAMEKRVNKEGGILTVETKEEKGKCKIIITDNGEGMDSEALSRLFEPYFTTKPNGNGLGLTNTQNIILNHKGDITVSSEKNKGTCFAITLDFAK